MKKEYTKLLSAGIVCLLTGVFFLSPCCAYQGGSGLPSCHDDIAVQRTAPGESPDCTPPILDQKTSRDILKNFIVKKIKGKWYIFLSAEEFEGGFDTVSRWKSISLLISAVESLFSEQADCYIVRVPETSEEKDALLAGDYPQKLIAASAQHVVLPEDEKSDKKWPEYHHPLFYKISVY